MGDFVLLREGNYTAFLKRSSKPGGSLRLEWLDQENRRRSQLIHLPTGEVSMQISSFATEIRKDRIEALVTSISTFCVNIEI